jgi:acid phosphatase
MLTAEGEHQLASLGGQIRQRYGSDGLLKGGFPKDYDRSHVYVRSTQYDRTLQSAMSLLQGVFPPGTGMHLPDTSPALAAGVAVPPVHTVELKQDLMLRAFNSDTCPTWDTMLKSEQTQFSGDFKDRKAKAAPLVASLGAAVGLPDLGFEGLGSVADSLTCMQAHNYTWPANVTQSMFEDAHSEAQWLTMNTYRTPRQRQASAGTALAMVAARFQAAAAGTAQPGFDPTSYPNATGQQLLGPSLAIYSAHDTTLLTLLYALQGSGAVWSNPPYASSLVFELVAVTSTAPPAVRVWYNRGIGTPGTGGGAAPFAAANLLHTPKCANTTGASQGDMLCELPAWLDLNKGIINADVHGLCFVESTDQAIARAVGKVARVVIPIATACIGIIVGALLTVWWQRKMVQPAVGAGGTYAQLDQRVA